MSTTRLREMQEDLVRALRDKGTVPPGVDDPEAFFGSRSGFFWADQDVAYDKQMATVEHPTSELP